MHIWDERRQKFSCFSFPLSLRQLHKQLQKCPKTSYFLHKKTVILMSLVRNAAVKKKKKNMS